MVHIRIFMVESATGEQLNPVSCHEGYTTTTSAPFTQKPCWLATIFSSSLVKAGDHFIVQTMQRINSASVTYLANRETSFEYVTYFGIHEYKGESCLICV